MSRCRPRATRAPRRTGPRLAAHCFESLERRLALDSTAVLSELYYHPAGDDGALEWIELHNLQAVNLDLSGWKLSGGVDFTFSEGTVIGGGAYLVVAANPAALQAASGYVGALGPFAGQLSNSGESIRLVNNSDRTMDQVSYGDDGDWPVAPDGSGLTLAKRDLTLSSEEPASWTASRQIGGTPGTRNFPPMTPQVQETTLIGITDAWKYNQSGDQGTAWREVGYDDGAWPSGQALFYVTPATLPATKNTPLTIGQRTYYFRTTFDFSGDLGSAGLKIRPIIDDGAVYYLNGAEVYRQNMPAAPTEITYNTLASPAVATAAYAGPFSIPTTALVQGTNTFAVEVHQASTTSNDVVFGTELIATQTIVDPGSSLPEVRLNEVVGAAEASFQLELFNPSAEAVDLAGMVVTHSSASDADFELPAQSLLAGQYLALSEATLGFHPGDGDKLFLYTAGKANLIDAVTVKPTGRGRSPDATGPWRYTSGATFGAANSVSLHDELVINEVMYHQRPRFEQPASYASTSLLAVGSTWKYHDAGTDLGTAWREPAYDDSAWSSGAALLYYESATLPAPKNTPLAPGRNTYYFRQAFDFAGSLSGVQLELNPIVDDGAVFYLNGQEVYRFNMPAGTVDYNSSAAAAVADAAFTGPVIVPAAGLVVGNNVLAVEVHQATSPSGGGPEIVPGGGYEFAWDGSNGDFYTPNNPAPAPDNAALPAYGTTPFGSSQYGAGIHLITNVNDGRYGNSNSWLANFPAGDPNPYIGLNFNRDLAISSIAWGRDNGNTATDACGGTCTDRSLGVYTIQITNVASPGVGTPETGDAATGWQTLATVSYSAAGPGFSPYLRHRYTLAEDGNPVTARGLRIKVSDDDIAIDELEVNAATDAGSVDVAFGTTLAAVVETSPAQPFAEDPEEWIEIYNRSASTVDLTGWRLDEGIDFNFPAGTTLAPGGYLVVAKYAAALLAKFPGINVVGDFSGTLSNSSDRIVLKDPLNNPADELHYYDGGRWAGYADGAGSSLELRDPDSDNRLPEAWAASDESLRSSWQTYSYRGVAAAGIPPDRWNEFVIGLFGDGEVLVDDVQVIEFPDGAATHKLQNESFTADVVGSAPAAWRINGNHRTSRVVVDPDDAENKVLYLASSGQTNDRFNHAETTFVGNQPAVNGREYQISFKAKWLAGTNQFNTRLYFNRLAKRWSLDVPEQGGTPGTQNSRFAANAGPTYGDLRHAPVVPNPNEAVTVSVVAADPDGVAQLAAKYSVNGGAFASVTLAHQGAGLYSGQIPGQVASAIVQFYVEGQDALGAVSTFPAKGAASRALYKVQDNQAAAAAGKHSLRIIMTAADSTLLHDLTNVLSSEELGATVVYDESEVYYDVGVSLKGSMAARPVSSLVGFRLHFQPDRKFRGVHEDIELDRSGRGALVPNGQDEQLVKHLMLAAGDIPSMYDDLAYVISPRGTENGPALLMMAIYGDEFLESQYDNGDDGTVFNFDLIYYQNNTHNGQVEGLKIPTGYGHPSYNVDLEDLGDDKELYRWHFQIENHRAQDDYSRLIEFLQAMSLPAGGTGSELDLATQQLMDVDEWMRVFAAQSLAGVGSDIYGRGLPHNLKLYVRPEDGRVLAFPWDMDLSVFALPANADPFPSGNLRKVIEIPGNERLFWGHLHDLLSTRFNSSYLAPWVAHYGSLLPGQNFAGALSYLDPSLSTSRAYFINSQLPATVPFDVSSEVTLSATTLVAAGAGASALVPSVANGGDLLGTTWTQTAFDDGGWASGTTGVGYERQTGYAGLLGLDVLSAIDSNSDGTNENNSVLVRIPFTASDVSAFDALKLRMKYDDGFVAYLNGVKVAEDNAPASPAWNSEATASHDDAAAVVFQQIDISAYLGALVDGDNVLAIHGLNRGSTSSDMLILPELVAEDLNTGSNVINTDQSTITLAGSAWINVREIRIAGRAEPVHPVFDSVTTWSADIPLQFGSHDLSFEAYDFQGNLIATDTITVNTTAGQPLQDALRVTEVHYHPTDPTAAELLVDPTLEDDDFEFLEIQNIGIGTVELSGVQILDDVSFDFTGSAVTTLAPREYALVVESLPGFAVRYNAAGLRIAGEYSGNLSNGGGAIELRDALGQTIQRFTFDDNGPLWHPSTDGGGPSLVIVDPLAPAATWNDGASWRPSYLAGGSPGTADVLPASIVGRRIFYNNSAFDGNNPAAGASDDNAVATDKAALLPGQTATLANYTSFSKGINGLMIDVANLADAVSAADFSFRIGNNNSVAAWSPLATAPTVTIRPRAGTGGSTRVTLTWPDGTITKRWLQVTVLAGANSGLAADDVFYFGNAVGEAGNSTTDAVVNAADEIGARTNPVGPFPTAALTNSFDYNRDRLVNATDQIIARTNSTNPLTALRLISVPADAGSGSGAAVRAVDLGLVSLADEPAAAVSRRRRR